MQAIVIGHVYVEARLLGEPQGLLDGARPGRADHAAADQKQVRFVRLLLMDELQHRAAHDLDPVDDEGIVLQIGDGVFGVLPPPVFQQLLRAHAGPHPLDVGGLDQAFEDLVFQRHSELLLFAATAAPAP